MIRMTTSHKYDYKTEGYRKAWDPTTSIMAYFTGINRFQISLNNRGILTSIEEKTMATRGCMWESEMFTEDQMVAWENKPLPTKCGTTSKLTSQRTGSRGASIWQPRPSNLVSRMPHWLRKSRHQQKKKERCRQ